MRRTPATDTLFYGDNRHILRASIEDKSVDLVYLDPPFNSNATYNVLFRAPSGGGQPGADRGVRGHLGTRRRSAQLLPAEREFLERPSNGLESRGVL